MGTCLLLPFVSFFFMPSQKPAAEITTQHFTMVGNQELFPQIATLKVEFPDVMTWKG